jgi:hypothetical protein
VQRLGVGHRLRGRAHVGLGDDLEEGRAGAIQVGARHAVEALVQELARVLLEVRAREPHAPLSSPCTNDTQPPDTTGRSNWLIW